ncbi:hypothetical protein [Yinghuangia sp. YIM S09857]|uniref:hypothetical protein n=1 Tax=Yinghuangia sp. YIM S09857 TaxID=3436929 RepID=UPI003F52ADB6
MSYAPPPGPHGGIPHQQQWGAATPPPPRPYRGPAAPRKVMVGVVGLLIIVATLSAMAFTALWWDNAIKETGFTERDPFKDLPAPRGLGVAVPGPADLPTGIVGGGA